MSITHVHLMATKTLRERTTAVLLDLQETGALTDVNAVDQAADAVLTQVQAWLRERAAAHTFDLAAAALRLAAHEMGLPDEGQD